MSDGGEIYGNCWCQYSDEDIGCIRYDDLSETYNINLGDGAWSEVYGRDRFCKAEKISYLLFFNDVLSFFAKHDIREFLYWNEDSSLYLMLDQFQIIRINLVNFLTLKRSVEECLVIDDLIGAEAGCFLAYCRCHKSNLRPFNKPMCEWQCDERFKELFASSPNYCS